MLFNEQFAKHQYQKANEILDKNKYIQKKKNRLLFLLDKGVTLQMMGKYEESNEFLEQAYIFIDDFQRNVGREAMSVVTNEMMRDYEGEDFEKIFLHYYKALNYIMLNQLEEAMVEARRINIKLNEINDKYKGENKYKRDAFAHVLIGLLYEASGDNNNAFIAYRNAYEIYQEDYSKFFAMSAPKQLKIDLIRSAAKSGIAESQEFYEKEFNLSYEDMPKANKEAILFWHNGLGPVKDEWSIFFTVIKGQGGLVMFENKELGLNFSFYMRSDNEKSSLGDLKVVRVAFPKYEVRKEVFTRGSAQYEGKEYTFELLENINEIALKSLRDRMVRELSKTLLRVALKQAAEQAARTQNEGVGAAVSVFNAATEKADTRNWQTLPARINYTRIPVKSDTMRFDILTYRGNSKMIEGELKISDKRKLSFGIFHSISPESLIIK
jgi:hypothetical protein